MTPPFIVAEIGANHQGDFLRASALVAAAAYAGANAVKFQTWTPGTMCLDDSYVIESGAWAGMRLKEIYEKAHTPWEWHRHLFEQARNLGMVPMSSPFDVGALQFLEGLGCEIYKVASFELVDHQLIASIARTGKPMMLSTGMATFDEIGSAWAIARTAGCKDITLLKCTSAYPADASEANLATLENMAKAFVDQGTDVGISDHTLGLAVPIAATVLGARVIEKHLTLQRAAGGLDAAFSLEPDEFAQMVQQCATAAVAIGTKHYGCTAKESTALRRSLWITRDLPRGHILTADDVATSRPAAGAAPRLLPSLLGRPLGCNVKAPCPLTEALLEH